MNSRLSVPVALVCAVVLLQAGARRVFAENIVFPDDAGVIDVTKPPYLAANDGSEDVAAVINQAFDDYPAKNKIIYLPNGTYLVRDTVRWSRGGEGAGDDWKWTILQGQSRDSTIIRLADHCLGYADTAAHKPVVWTGRAPAQRFRNAVRNLTVNTGSGNPGAIGIHFFANNTGCIRDVSIVSEDRTGVAGIEMAEQVDNGPLLVKNVSITGFGYGIWTDGEHMSMTFENVTLREQNRYGVYNVEQTLSFHNLVSHNAVPVVFNADSEGVVTLVDGLFEGTGEAASVPAVIIDRGALFARGIRISGYGLGVDNNVGHGNDFSGDSIAEFVSHDVLSVFPTEPSLKRSMGLQIKPTPEVPWDDTGSWVSPLDFGAVPDDKVDDTEAFRQALDAGSTTVYIPNGWYDIHGSLTIDGAVRHLIGCEAMLDWKAGTDTLFHLADGDHPTVVVERIFVGWDAAGSKVVATGNRQFVLREMDLGQIFIMQGEVFFEDIVHGACYIGPAAKVWARQWNIENRYREGGYNIMNDGGTLWVLGYKAERDAVKLHAKNKSNSEILGMFCYQNTEPNDTIPLIINEESNVAAVVSEIVMDTTTPSGWHGNGVPTQYPVVETREGVTDTLFKDSAYLHLNSSADSIQDGSMMPLYVGYADPGIPVVDRPLYVPGSRLRRHLRTVSLGSRGFQSSPPGAEQAAFEVYAISGRLLFRGSTGPDAKGVEAALERPPTTPGVVIVRYRTRRTRR